jgi:hypothetical protein
MRNRLYEPVITKSEIIFSKNLDKCTKALIFMTGNHSEKLSLLRQSNRIWLDYRNRKGDKVNLAVNWR